MSNPKDKKPLARGSEHSGLKLFIVKKYIMAKNAGEAIRKERKVKPDDVWIDDDWIKGRADKLADAIGFREIDQNGE